MNKLLFCINKGNCQLTFPSFRYLASPKVFNSTPLGDQLNLYLSGLSEHSGAGKPPQYDTKDSIFPPPCLTSSKHSIARRWSIPGSRPTSFTMVIPASRALKSSDNSKVFNNSILFRGRSLTTNIPLVKFFHFWWTVGSCHHVSFGTYTTLRDMMVQGVW